MRQLTLKSYSLLNSSKRKANKNDAALRAESGVIFTGKTYN